MRSFIGSESIIDHLYDIICRIVQDGGDPDDQETWDKYYTAFKFVTDATIPEDEIHMKDARGNTVGRIVNVEAENDNR